MSYGMASPTGLKPSQTTTGGSGLSGGNKIPKGYQQGQLSQYTPEQTQLFNQGIQNVGPDSYTARLARGDQDLFNEMEAPAYRQFNAAQGQLAGRFSGSGGGGQLSSRNSSGFQNTAGQLGSDFAQDLASKRSELMRGATMDLHNMSQQLLGNRPYDQFLVEEQQKQNPWADIAGKFAGAIPQAVASYFNPLSGFSNASNNRQSFGID